jgi:hypothetical protein
LHCISCSFHFKQSQGFQFCGFVLCFAERSWCTLCQHEEAMSFLFYRVQSSVSEIVSIYKRMSKGQSSPWPRRMWIKGDQAPTGAHRMWWMEGGRKLRYHQSPVHRSGFSLA